MIEIVVPGKQHPSLNKWTRWHWGKKDKVKKELGIDEFDFEDEEELLEDLKFWKELYNNYLDKAKNKDAPLTTLKNYIFKKRYYYYKLYFVECEILRRCSQ